MTERVVADDVAAVTRHPPTQERINRARIAYQHRLLLERWDFDTLGARLRRRLGLRRDHRRMIDAKGADTIDALERQTLDAVVTVAAKFRGHPRSLFRDDLTPKDDAPVHERPRKASACFAEQIQRGVRPWLGAFSFGTNNKALSQQLGQAVDERRQALAVKTAGVESCRAGFATAAHLGALTKARLDAAPKGPPTGQGFEPRAGDAEGPGLLGALRCWRDQKGQEEAREGVERYRVLGPRRPAADRRHPVPRPGVTGRRQRHRQADRRALRPSPPRPGQPPKTAADASEGSTRLISYRLCQEGLRGAEIASRRSLQPDTSAGHLAVEGPLARRADHEDPCLG